MAHRDLARHADPAQRLGLEGQRIDAGFGLAREVQVEIDDGRRRVFHRGEALVEGAGGQQPAQQVLGHRLAGAVVAGVRPQHLGCSSQCS